MDLLVPSYGLILMALLLFLFFVALLALVYYAGYQTGRKRGRQEVFLNKEVLGKGVN